MTRDLPRDVTIPGGPVITVARGPVHRGLDAFYDYTTATIVVDERLEGPAAHVALLHEVLHALEDHLRRIGRLKSHVPHSFLNHGDTLLLGLLVEAGLYRGISRGVWREWYRP